MCEKINMDFKKKNQKKNQQTDLSTLGVGCQQIYHFDASHQDLLLHTHVSELRGFSMNRSSPAK